jgi:hypothetical protein
MWITTEDGRHAVNLRRVSRLSVRLDARLTTVDGVLADGQIIASGLTEEQTTALIYALAELADKPGVTPVEGLVKAAKSYAETRK